jgi:hypothetical protein
VDIHPALESIGPLLGVWAGDGRGQYPTIDSFAYTEEISFLPGPGKPFAAYTQRTWAADGSPLHAEVGYLRVTPDGLELIIAQPTGLVEIHQGEKAGRTLVFRSLSVHASPTAKAVGEVVRRLTVDGDSLSYTLDMAYAEVSLTLHLEATLHRVLDR